MTGTKPKEIQLLESKLGQVVFESDWMCITQQETDQFATLTKDVDPMHNDPVWAAKTHWGGTIVQAAHVLSLGAGVVADGDTSFETVSDGNSYVLNYGYDKIRVIMPLRVGHNFRYVAKLINVRPKSENKYVLKYETTVEVEGRKEPFIVYESLVFWATNQSMAEVTKV